MLEPIQAFYVPIFKVSIDQWQDKKQKLLDLIDFDDPTLWHDSHFTDYHKNSKSGCAYTLDFMNILNDELNDIIRAMGKGINIQLLWAQRYAAKQYMAAHNHGNTGYSCVLYADFDAQEHTATRFFAPFHNFHTGKSLEYTPQVQEGDMIFFPSILFHDAAPNASEKQRTIFSFNCRFVDDC